MPERCVDNCPYCQHDFVAKHTSLRRMEEIGKSPNTTEEVWQHQIQCAKGHRFDLLIETNQHPRYTVVVPERPSKTTHKRLRTVKPCGGCGKPIQPGQLFVGGVETPKHIGC